MLGRHSLPPQPPRSLSLRNLFAEEAAEPRRRGIQAQKSGDESLFGSFIKSRHENVAVEFTIATEHKPTRKTAPKYRRSNSLQQIRSTPSSNEVPASPNPSNKFKSAPRDPSLLKSPSSQLPKSSKHRSPRIRGSPRGSPRGTPPRGANANTGAPLKSKSLHMEVKDSFPDLGTTIKSKNRLVLEQDDGTQSLPSLVDDSIVRDTVAGFRGGKQWHIMEDTPGGHAEEKLNLVMGIECLDEEDASSWRPGAEEAEALEEDDDIVDDPGLIEYEYDNDNDNDVAVDIERGSRKQMFPTDPANGPAASAAASTQLSKVSVSASAGDRFNPSFKNHDIWTTDDEGDGDDKNLLGRCPSGDVSILSDPYMGMEGDLETVSERSDFAFSVDQDSSEHNEIESFKDVSSTADLSKTPATAKRSGGCRRSANMGSVPSLEDDSAREIAEDDDIQEDSLRHPASVPEDSPLDGTKRKSRRKKKTTPSATPSPSPSTQLSPSSRRHSSSAYERGKGSTSARSSKRRSGNVGSRRQSGMEPSAMRRSQRSLRIPDVVPSTPSQVRSLSSTLTSTPTSWVSSARQQQQQLNKLQALVKQPSPRNSPRRRKNKPLQLHVDREICLGAGDDNTLGASTITTNFSTTQRTLGDNTVSTRSLFKSEKMCNSESLRIPQRSSEILRMPQRRRADSESDESAEKPLSTRSAVIDSNFQMLESAEVQTPLDNPLNSPAEKTLKALVRKVSGEGDDLLAMVTTLDSNASSGSISDGSDFERWQMENGKDLISPKATLRKQTAMGGSATFLQLEPDTKGFMVDSKMSSVPDLDSPLKITVQVSKPTELDNSFADLHEEEAVDKFDTGKVPGLTTQHGPDSPPVSLFSKSKRRKSRLSLFRRVQSWKGVVALSDDEDD